MECAVSRWLWTGVNLPLHERGLPPWRVCARQRATQSREGIAADEVALEAARERAVAAQTGASEGEAARKVLLDGIGALERQVSVEGGYAGAVEALGRLKRDMPATVAKMERARVAGGYVVTRR